MIRTILRFLMGLVILASTVIILCFAAAIFDTAPRVHVDTYFFQPNNLSVQRVGQPQTVAELGPDKMRQLLVEHYISEYFYVIPDAENIEQRMRSNSPLALMSANDVFENWRRVDGKEIENLVKKNAFRTARVIGDIHKPAGSDFWVVEYELRTWYKSNDLREEAEIRRGVLNLGLFDDYITDFKPGFDVEGWLKSGGDPAVIFRFGVLSIGLQN